MTDQGPWTSTCPKWALGLGSIAPDLPLYCLTIGGLLYFGVYQGWPPEKVARHLFQNLYYKDPVWIALHSFLHSPTMLLILLALATSVRKWQPVVVRWSYFFLASCLLHAIVDVLTHFDDGPVLFFPINWNVRFASPVSYWDKNHFGREFMVFEATLDGVILIWLGRIGLQGVGNQKKLVKAYFLLAVTPSR